MKSYTTKMKKYQVVHEISKYRAEEKREEEHNDYLNLLKGKSNETICGLFARAFKSQISTKNPINNLIYIVEPGQLDLITEEGPVDIKKDPLTREMAIKQLSDSYTNEKISSIYARMKKGTPKRKGFDEMSRKQLKGVYHSIFNKNIDIGDA